VTFRLTLGIDPGMSGAIAVVADGEPTQFIDMPTMARPKSGNEINTAELSARLRGLLQQYSGAYVIAILENVHAMPGQGVSSTFRFGESFGCIKGVLGALAIPYKMVEPTVWKRKFGLLGKEKDFARTNAIQMFPSIAGHLARKKDGGRADALLMARWAHETEQVAA
jgi:hypothetical protein